MDKGYTVEVTERNGEKCIIAHFTQDFAQKCGSELSRLESYTVLATRDEFCGQAGYKSVTAMHNLHSYDTCEDDPNWGPLIPFIKQWVEEYMYPPKELEPPISRFRAIIEGL